MCLTPRWWGDSQDVYTCANLSRIIPCKLSSCCDLCTETMHAYISNIQTVHFPSLNNSVNEPFPHSCCEPLFWSPHAVTSLTIRPPTKPWHLCFILFVGVTGFCCTALIIHTNSSRVCEIGNNSQYSVPPPPTDRSMPAILQIGKHWNSSMQVICHLHACMWCHHLVYKFSWLHNGPSFKPSGDANSCVAWIRTQAAKWPLKKQPISTSPLWPHGHNENHSTDLRRHGQELCCHLGHSAKPSLCMHIGMSCLHAHSRGACDWPDSGKLCVASGSSLSLSAGFGVKGHVGFTPATALPHCCPSSLSRLWWHWNEPGLCQTPC